MFVDACATRLEGRAAVPIMARRKENGSGILPKLGHCVLVAVRYRRFRTRRRRLPIALNPANCVWSACTNRLPWRSGSPGIGTGRRPAGSASTSARRFRFGANGNGKYGEPGETSFSRVSRVRYDPDRCFNLRRVVAWEHSGCVSVQRLESFHCVSNFPGLREELVPD